LSNDYKIELRTQLSKLEHKDSSLIRALLVTSLPKYIWVCTLYHQDGRVFDLILDSTDLLTLNSCFLAVMIYNSSTVKELCELWSQSKLHAIKEKKKISHLGDKMTIQSIDE